MEGIASEAASLAGQLGLGRLVYLYDDNDISLDGPTSLSFDRENVDQRFEAYGWHVDGRPRRERHGRARDGDPRRRSATTEQPSLIRVKSIIGYPSPNKQARARRTARRSARTRSR